MIEIKHDGKFDLATGRSRRETSWKNKEWLWSDFLEKISKTHYTAETQAEYLAATKTRQDEIKDIGGFCGGYLLKGKRQANSILHRQLITLDLDFSTLDFWEDFIMLYGCAAALYSTHKHSSESPRFRLLILADRPMAPDEYQAASRKLAGNVGIENFDPTTFQPERLMYWPSTSKDAEFIFEYQDGVALNVDEILDSYRNWRDTSAWPVSVKVDKIIRNAMSKQGDPLEKKGVIGAFCRTYSIQEVIENYLSDVYESCDKSENRYTYKEGSTSGGVVVYEDKFAYSHHGTDPSSNILCNAFDLVRIHKFGLKDEDVNEKTPINKMPSYTAMLELATSDKKVKSVLISEKLNSAKSDFAEIEGLDDEEAAKIDDSWQENLDVDRKGNVYPTTSNILKIFENDPAFKNKIGYDDFEKCDVALFDLPWRKIANSGRRLIDSDDSNIRLYLESVYGISNVNKTRDAMNVLATRKAFHPVRDYLNSLKWDGIKRVDSLLIDYQGADNSEYTRTVTRKILTAAVARVFRPGIKFDHVLVLVGEQGMKKSTLISKLGMQWFSDSFNTIEGKESFEQLQGVWIIEIGELAALAKSDVEKIKHFITKPEDRYRVAFGRRVERFPRQCVFFGTTNKKLFLKDSSGDRRYWPALVNLTKPEKDVFIDLTQDEIDQIWAESVVNYKAGESLYLNDAMTKIATAIQKSHTEEHPWTGKIEKYLDTKTPTNWGKMNIHQRRNYINEPDELLARNVKIRTRVCLSELWDECVGKSPNVIIDTASANVIRNIMQNMNGWVDHSKPVNFGIHGTQRKSYYRIDIETEKEVTEREKEVTKPLEKVTN
jgi:putative DNA primase/helicase